MTAVAMLLFAIVVTVMIKRFDYREGRGLFLYYLCGKKKREILSMTAGMIEVLFVLTAVLFQKNIEINYLLALIIIKVMVVAPVFSIRAVAAETVNTILVFLALFCGNIMFRYLEEIRIDTTVLILYVALNFFTVLYSSYACVHNMLRIQKSI